MCGNLITHLIAGEMGLPLESVPGFTPRPPVKPVPIGVMAQCSEDAQSAVSVIEDRGRPLVFASEGWTHF